MARIIAATIDHVIAQRVVRRYSIAQPRTDAGRTIYTLALKLTQSTTSDEAAVWGCTTGLRDISCGFAACRTKGHFVWI